MLIVIGVLLGAFIGAGLFSGFGSEAWIGAAMGGLAAWLWQVQTRLRRLEHNLQRRPARSAPALGGEREREHVAGPETVPPQSRPAAPTWDEPPRRREPGAAAQAAAPLRRESGAAAEAAAGSRPTSRVEMPYRTEPLAIERSFAAARRWLTTGNVPVKVGVVVSVFGLGFLIKEAMDRHWLVLPLELRLVGVAAVGIVLLGIGWRVRKSNPVYALSVQGGGIAVLYLTTYAAFGLYALLPSPVAFFLLVVITVSAGLLAVLQDSRALAVLGIVGGFMAPVLVSTGAGNHVILFSYYAILNGAVFGIAWFKAWRELNVLGFGFTFIVGSAWGYLGYRPEHFATTEPFLVLFVLIYTIIPILFARKQQPRLKGFVDGTLVFGTPIVGFGLQTQLVESEYGLAVSAAGLAGLYVGLASWMYRRHRSELRVLTEAFLSLGVVFLTLAIPLAIDARWTSAAWSLEGAALIWIGWRQDRKLPLAAGLAMQVLAAGAYELGFSGAAPRFAFLNGQYFGGALIAVAAAFSSWVFERIERARGADLAKLASWATLAWAAVWWGGAGYAEIDRAFPPGDDVSAALIYLALSTWLAMLLSARCDWPRIRTLGIALVPLAVLGLLASVLVQAHPLAHYGWLAWPIVLGTHLAFLARSEGRIGGIESALHVLGFWLTAAIVTSEVHWWIGRATSGIWDAAAALACVAALVLVVLHTRERVAWPLRAHARAYVAFGCGGLLGVGGFALLVLNAVSPGNAAPLPYVPVLNPLELASAFFLVVALRWNRVAERSEHIAPIAPRLRIGSLVALGLFLLTMVVGRTVHHWAGVPFDLEALAESNVFQAAISIVWGSTALIGMVLGARQQRRGVWIGGAALMAAVVIKLFLVELGNTGTVTRVVSFLGVGLLLLIVGYFAPAPPRGEPDAQSGGGSDAASEKAPGSAS